MIYGIISDMLVSQYRTISIPSMIAKTPSKDEPSQNDLSGKIQQAKENAIPAQLPEDVNEPMTPSIIPTPATKPPLSQAKPQTVDVKIPTGTSSPGCEQTKSCLILTQSQSTKATR